MSDSVFVVQEQRTGMWTAECIDRRCDAQWTCGGGSHPLAYTKAKSAADRAATVHRKLLATMPDEAVWPPRPSQCPSCGQSKTVIRDLQDLVRQLEQRLAESGGQR